MTQRIGAESRAVFAHIAELLRAQGAELRDVVSVGGWLTFPMRDYGPLGDVRDTLMAETGLFPASAAVQVGRVRSDGALLAFEAIAFAPKDPVERERWRAASLPAPSPLAPYYASARSAGGYVFTCGEVPTGTADPDRPAAVQTQAGEVYERLGTDLAAHGASPASVVHQTVFVRRPRDRDAVADAARVFYGADALPPPPTTLLGAADIGFHPGCDVEIELVAATDGR
jgi:enamine deaminase RidA (YjgF/YER057c/UK114 family)